MNCRLPIADCRLNPAGRRASDALALSGVAMLAVLLFCGCATRKEFVGSRPFDFGRDTFTFTNELNWIYHFDADGKWVHETRKPKPEYEHRCFVVVRSARQFFQNATFDPASPEADEATYRRLIRRVIDVDPDRAVPAEKRIVIPGYADLRAFSEAHAALLKDECGGAWHSYFQRGNWRMIFPFSHGAQEETAERLVADLEQHRPPIIHLVRFPQLTINHAMLLFAAQEYTNRIEFAAYDPNAPDAPKTVTYDRSNREFTLPMSNYWPGGRVNVYEVYRNWKY